MESKKPNRRSNQSKSEQPEHQDRPGFVRRYVMNKKTAIVVGSVIVIVITALIIGHFNSGNTPTYHTVLPGDKSVSELGGWKRISPPGKDPVFAYSDKVNGVPITVSQQPLPASFKTETASHIAELAKSYNADTKVNAGEITVYIGTSSKGPQSVIFAKENLLVLIKSQKSIDNSAWTEYIQTLDNPGSGRIPKY